MESFNGTPGEELLSHELFVSFEEACWVIDRWRLDYNHQLDYQTPAAYAAGCVLPASATPQPPEHSALPTPILSLNLVQRLGGSHCPDELSSSEALFGLIPSPSNSGGE